MAAFFILAQINNALYPVNEFLQQRLNQRGQQGMLRSLKTNGQMIDFCSNDYLGFARSPELKTLVEAEMQHHPAAPNGSTGSRLLAGNTAYAMELEQRLAALHRSEAGLLFNSGYDANLGLFSALPQRGDTVLHDELIHASVIDGIRLSHATRHSFRHNDLQSLEDKLSRSTGRCFVAAESIYSMDGDTAPLAGMAGLCSRYGASLIVDEAHATGLFGTGLVQQLNLQEQVFARVVTFGKALGVHGAIVLGSRLLMDYLINFARSFIYTTAAPFHQLAAISAAYQLLAGAGRNIDRLNSHIHYFKKAVKDVHAFRLIRSESAIQCLVSGSAHTATQAATRLQQAGLDVRAILSPTVAAGSERLRVCLHSFNTTAEMELLTHTLKHLNE